MEDFLTEHWWLLASVTYVSGFLAVAFWEMAAPRREWSVSTLRRWTNNFAVFITSAAATYLLIPALTVGFSQMVFTRSWGVFNVLGHDGLWVVVAGVIIMDFAQYIEHRMMHQIPILWRLHRMHHADMDYDVTTGFRFHPLEGILATGWRMVIIATFGVPIVSVMLAELLLIAMNYFVHGNARVPLDLDRLLRRVIVTPDLHRVHHSIEKIEANANFGSVFSFWDRALGTYVAQPAAGHKNMVIGLEGFQEHKHMNLPWMLANPFLTPATVAITNPEQAQQVNMETKIKPSIRP
ncbi:sterol desaturase family protein [Sedimenticola sp.]|uniref:sterol desaturase family protein n=1 Tax=Sedimenticola sp. TaxID=1940285 RepID=UPI003D132AB9